MGGTGSPSIAAEGVVDLLRPGIQVRRNADPEYFDVLDRTGPRRDQGMFRRSFLPPVYERLWRPVVARKIFGRSLGAAEERRIALEMLGVSPADRVADIGCGPGNYTRHLAAAAPDGRVVGVDASRAMIARAVRQNRAANTSYLRANACELPFVDGCFDAICCIGVLHMLDDPMAALDELVRVLGAGGRMLLLVTCENKSVPRVKGKMTGFGRDEMTGALAERGLVEVEQRVFQHGQFVAGRRAEQ